MMYLARGSPSLHRRQANPGASMEIEAGVPPGQDELGRFLCDLPSPEEHPQHFMLKDFLQGCCLAGRRYLK